MFKKKILQRNLAENPRLQSLGWRLISFDPRQHLHSLVRYFKGTSSRILREKYPELRSRIPSL